MYKYKLIIILLIFSFAASALSFEDKTLLAGKIVFTDNIDYQEALKLTMKLSSLSGVHILFVRKMGKKNFGTSLVMKFDGSKEEKHKILQRFRNNLGQNIKSWDLATGVTWVHKAGESKKH